ncbi:MBL fold metallo-hydrolase [Hyphomicrobium sp. ghe19]|uniref:MBL fold metallo-hydrolase n=1 Tax=Hyphomicrobium sp. ghe19 TaxID=2682968 RepID=UPI0030D3CB90
MDRANISRHGFCLCCIGAAQAGLAGWLTPRAAYAVVSLIKDSAAVAAITVHHLRGNVSVLEGSGGNVAVLTGPDGKVLIDAGIRVSQSQMTKALDALSTDPITHLINTHWHFDDADGNEWLHAAGAKITAHERIFHSTGLRGRLKRPRVQFRQGVTPCTCEPAATEPG